jgi:hypothetical protein
MFTAFLLRKGQPQLQCFLVPIRHPAYDNPFQSDGLKHLELVWSFNSAITRHFRADRQHPFYSHAPSPRSRSQVPSRHCPHPNLRPPPSTALHRALSSLLLPTAIYTCPAASTEPHNSVFPELSTEVQRLKKLRIKCSTTHFSSFWSQWLTPCMLWGSHAFNALHWDLKLLILGS